MPLHVSVAPSCHVQPPIFWLQNYHFCGHNSVVSVVCFPSIHLCFYVRPLCNRSTKNCLCLQTMNIKTAHSSLTSAIIPVACIIHIYPFPQFISFDLKPKVYEILICLLHILLGEQSVFKKLISTMCYSEFHTTEQLAYAKPRCCLPSAKHDSHNNHHYPSNKWRNLNCSEGHTDVSLDYKIQEDLIWSFLRKKNASYCLESMVLFPSNWEKCPSPLSTCDLHLASRGGSVENTQYL